MGARTDAARAEVVARRQVLLNEATRLEAAGRSAVDFKAKIRKSPAKTAALVASTAFIALGGPKRTFRTARRAIFGPGAELPQSMLPEQIDKALRSLGTDGDRVRGVIEREFADYLEKGQPTRDSRDLGATVAELGGSLLRPVTAQAGKRLAEELFKPEGGSFGDVMGRIQHRREARQGDKATTDRPAGAAAEGGRRRGLRGRRRG